MLSHKPSGRKDYKIKSGSPKLKKIIPLNGRFASQYCKDTGIWVVIRYGTDSIIKVQVILEWHVITSPSHNIVWRICAFSFKHFAYILIDNL